MTRLNVSMANVNPFREQIKVRQERKNPLNRGIYAFRSEIELSMAHISESMATVNAFGAWVKCVHG